MKAELYRIARGVALVRSPKGWTVVSIHRTHVSGEMPRDGGWHCAAEDIGEMAPRWYSKSHAYETWRKLSRRRASW